MRETRVRKAACLNPDESLPETIFPVTRPRRKEWRTRGVRSILLRVMKGRPVPLPREEVMFLKNWIV